MSILTWIDDNERLKLLNASKYIRPSTDSNKGLWTRCDKCGVILYIKHLIENQRVCFGCAYHLQMNSPERIKNLLDKDSWRPFDETISPCDPLEFHDQKNYTDRLQAAQDKTGLQDAIQTGSGRIEGIPVALGVMDFDFMGGSMGSVVGEKITRLIEYATQEGLTLILICASGGARMQEGVFGLMQMAKISSALRIYQSCANLLYISILTSPTTGGVTASFGMLGDIIFAEPRALIAFAGRRVIEQTLCEDLPEDFQSSEYMLNHGLVDLIVPRRFLRQALSESIKFYKNAPFKKTGKIPFGVQNPINFVTEEKVRRQWLNQVKWGEQSSALDRNTEFGDKGLTKPPALFELREPKESSKLNRRYFNKDEAFVSSSSNKNEVVQASKQGVNALLGNTVVQKHNDDYKQAGKARNQSKYRDILTSFQMVFNLFGKQLALPDPSSENKVSLESRKTKLPAFSDFNDSTNSKTTLNNSLSSQQDVIDSRSPLPNESKQEIEVFLPINSEKDINLLNQAIELAATESIEWRSFYVSQRISKTTAEDFFQSETGLSLNLSEQVQPLSKQNDTILHNTLFYKSICRSTLR